MDDLSCDVSLRRQTLRVSCNKVITKERKDARRDRLGYASIFGGIVIGPSKVFLRPRFFTPARIISVHLFALSLAPLFFSFFLHQIFFCNFLHVSAY